MEEKISSELKLIELRKRSFRQTLDQLHGRASSTLLLTLQWKDIEDHFDSTHVIEERAKELRSIRQKLEDVKKREKELEVVQESVKDRFTEIEEREKKFELSQRKEIEEQKKEIELIEKSGRELEAVRASIERKLIVLEESKQKFELFNNSIEERAGEVRVIDREVCKALKEIEGKVKHCEQFFNELKLKEKQVEERSKELAFKDENFSKLFLEFEMKEEKLEEQCKELRLKDEKIIERFKDLEFKEKQIQARCEELELENKKIMERDKELELKERQLEKRYKEFELKEKHFIDGYNTRVKMESPNTYVVNNAMDCPWSANLSATMDGKALQIFLNEHRGKYDSMRNEVLIALRLSSDPAKLVLDAMQGFYPPHLKKGDMGFEEGVVRRSCILLLEQLMKISPEIRPYVKGEAMVLAFDWRIKMKIDAEHSLEVLGFLQLLASYRLVSVFDADSLLAQLEIVAQHSQAPKLLRALGFADKIYDILPAIFGFCVTGFLQNLIRKKQHIVAIRFIYAFDLVNEFTPVPLLEDYLKDSKKAYQKNRRHKSIEARIEATNKRIVDMRAALICIEEYKIESELSFKYLRKIIGELENSNSNKKAMLTAPGCESQPPYKSPRTAVSVDDPNAFIGAACAVYSIRMPSKETAVLSSNLDSIQVLIESNRRIEAIKYIYALEMVDKFPPVHLLHDHLSYVKKSAKRLCKKQKNSISGQIDSIDKQIAGLRAVINCIATYNLESEFSPNILEERIMQLKRKMPCKKKQV